MHILTRSCAGKAGVITTYWMLTRQFYNQDTSIHAVRSQWAALIQHSMFAYSCCRFNFHCFNILTVVSCFLQRLLVFDWRCWNQALCFHVGNPAISYVTISPQIWTPFISEPDLKSSHLTTRRVCVHSQYNAVLTCMSLNPTTPHPQRPRKPEITSECESP